MKIIVENISVEYEKSGKGKLALLLHGWGDSLHTFDLLCSELEKKFSIVRLDLPGFGASEMPPTAWGVEDYAQFVKDFCRKLHLEPQYIIGHSLGGRIAIKICSQKLLNPQKLILLASAGIRESNSARNRSYATVAKIGKVALSLPGLKRYQKAARSKLYKTAGTQDYLVSGPLKETFVKVIHEDLRDDAVQIEQSTLLLYGEQDTETPVHYGKLLHNLIPKSELDVITSASHFMHQEKPQVIVKAIENFLK